MKYFSMLLLLFFASSGFAQGGLVAYFPMEDCEEIEEVTGVNDTAFPQGFDGGLTCACGVRDSALIMRGEYQGANGALFQDQVFLIGNYDNYFDDDDFSISIFFKATESNGNRTIYSKLDSCSAERGLQLRYTAATSFITAYVGESASKKVELFGRLNPDRCWHHIALVRRGNRVKLFADGEILDDKPTVSAMDIRNEAEFILGSGPCVGLTDFPFEGFIDELRVYNRALTDVEVRDLNLPTDIIGNRRDTLIVEGTSVDISIGPTCVDDFAWTPSDPDFGVLDPLEPETTITPPESGQYVLTFEHTEGEGCFASDTINITVVSPDSLDCSEIFLPKAFTPNDDGLNDSYGISNPYAIIDFTSFEIFDRWGGRVFYSTDAYATWDGDFNGRAVNPGVCMYRVVYNCQGEEKILIGSLTVLR
ncbi:MAG: LamG-like jellyroll fold domain-containing protein [Bacteroidota bacterium]